MIFLNFLLSRYVTKRPRTSESVPWDLLKIVFSREMHLSVDLNDFRATAMEMSQHIYVNPKSFDCRLYDKSEVLYMLWQIGNLDIPVSARNKALVPKLRLSNPTPKKQTTSSPKSNPKSAPNPNADFNDSEGKR